MRLKGVNDEHLNTVLARLKRRYGVKDAGKLIHDLSGHYQRGDVFEFAVGGRGAPGPTAGAVGSDGRTESLDDRLDGPAHGPADRPPLPPSAGA